MRDVVERRLVKDLEPYARNPRTHSDAQVEQIAASIREFGWTNPILTDGNRVIAGHGRLKAAVRLGLADVPCIELGGLSEDQKRAYVIADNQLALTAGWDPGLLAAELGELDGAGFDTALTGFSGGQLADLLGLSSSAPEAPSQTLAERFLIPPFSVFNAREGWWQDRKRAWIALGIRSELGRGGTPSTSARAEPGEEPSYREIGGGGRDPTPGGRGANSAWRDSGSKANASPGGSPRPAMDYSNNERGDGAGKPLRSARANAEPSGGGGGGWAKFNEEAQARRDKLQSGTSASSNAMDYAGGFEDAATGSSGTSIFDPVLCEIAYRWFSPPGGLVLDPFAGGSVRGIVAAKLGRRYIGLDLREEQVAANREQAAEIAARELPGGVALPEDYAPEQTPVEQRGAFWFKRDDLFCMGGVRGGKVRTCAALARGAQGIVTAGHRSSPQVNIVANVARALGIPCAVHTPGGELTPELRAAVLQGAEIVQHPAGYNNVIIARAREDAQARGWTEIPFGMECQEAITQTASQTVNIPEGVKRIVMPVGSGMSLAGVLHGLKRAGRDIPVLGVCVGAEPIKRLDAYAPEDWRSRAKLVQSRLEFHQHGAALELEGVPLDPIYESKCVPFLEPGDCFWLVGLRQTRDPTVKQGDLPVYDLIEREPRIEDAPAPAPASAPAEAPGAPAWAKGYPLAQLKALAAVFKRHDAGLALGAFTGVKENQIAEWLSSGELRYAPSAEAPEAAAVVRRAGATSSVEDFSGASLGFVRAGDLQIKRLAGPPALCAQLLAPELEGVRRAWLELWQEKESDRALAWLLGFSWLGSKIRASSEIVGVWGRGIPKRETPPEELAALCRLALPARLDIAPLAARIAEGALSWADHYSTYNKGRTWSALALRGYGGDPGFIIKPSEMSKKWKAENAPKLAWGIADTPLREELPEAEPLIRAIPGVKHRVRLMRLAPLEGELTRHADITDPDAGVAPGRLLRIHLPIVTNPEVVFRQWLLSGEDISARMGLGEAWYLDTRKPHTAVNRGAAARVHLVLDVESCPELLALLPARELEEAHALES